jgi:hypothetical protein
MKRLIAVTFALGLESLACLGFSAVVLGVLLLKLALEGFDLSGRGIETTDDSLQLDVDGVGGIGG